MIIKQELNRTPYRFKDIHVGELFYAIEIVGDAAGSYTLNVLYLKTQEDELTKNNAVKIEYSWNNGGQVHIDDDYPVEYVDAEIIIKEIREERLV